MRSDNALYEKGSIMDIINKQIDIPYLLKIGSGKIAKIGKYLFDKGMMQIALFMGEGIENIIGADLRSGIKKWNVNIAYEHEVKEIDIDNITHQAFFLPSVSAIVGVGGGKALDFAKYAAHLLKLPFISIPTAISNDGFSSPTSSLTVLGQRKSVKSGIPFGVVIDLDIIKNSPDIFLYSGIGDMLSKVTALRDWRMARDKGLERYVDFAAVLAYNSLDILFLKYSYDIHSSNFQRSLASSLTMSGLSMEIAGSSRPASGSEHLISHALDTICKKPKMHGIQVGIATYLCALLQKNDQAEGIRIIFSETGFSEHVYNDPFDYNEFITAIRLAPTIKSNFYTILSEHDSFDRAVTLIENDGLLNKALKRG